MHDLQFICIVLIFASGLSVFCFGEVTTVVTYMSRVHSQQEMSCQKIESVGTLRQECQWFCSDSFNNYAVCPANCFK